MSIWHAVHGQVEVSLNVMIDEDGTPTGKMMLEVECPYYPTFSGDREALVHNMQKAREQIFGYQFVYDLSNVPVDTPGLIFPDAGILHAEVWNPDTKRIRYQYFGTPKAEFDPNHMRWGGQLVIDGPRKEVTGGKEEGTATISPAVQEDSPTDTRAIGVEDGRDDVIDIRRHGDSS